MNRSVGLRGVASVWDFHPFDLPNWEWWFDFSDEGSITDSSGRVTAVADGTENGNDITSSGDARPWTGEDTTPTSLNCLRFEGGQRLINGDWEHDAGNPNLTLISVAKLDLASDAENASTLVDGFTTRTGLYRGTEGDEPGQWAFGWDDQTADGIGFANTDWKVLTGMRSIGFPSASRLWVNNVLQDTAGAGDLLMGGISVGNVYGAPVSANRGHRGLIAFAACRRGLLGVVDQANVNAWLSSRFGVYPF